MIEFDEKRRIIKRKKRKSPKTKGKGKAAAYHPSEAKSEMTKSRVRDDRGVFLGKREIWMKIGYSFEEQKYRLEMKSGNGMIDETQDCGGIPRVLFIAEKTIKNWRGQLE